MTKKHGFAIILVTALLGLFSLLTGCTQQERVKLFGGVMTLDLPCDTKLFEITWKDNNLWYAVRPMTPADSVTTYVFQESSSFGVNEGKVVVRECRVLVRG